MVRMTVEGVGFDHSRQTVVVLKDWEGKKVLPIWIGPAEARSIQIELEGAQPARPMSHDLLLSIIGSVAGRVTRVIINDLVDSTFYATIDIDTPKGTKNIDARPSDAIALAVRAKCPIFVDGNVVESLVDAEEIQSLPNAGAADAADEGDSAGEDEISRFRRLLGDE